MTTGFTHRLDEVLSSIQILVVIFALLMWGVGLLALIRTRTFNPIKKQKAQKVYFCAIAAFAVLVTCPILMNRSIAARAQVEVAEFFVDPVKAVEVNNVAVANPAQLIVDLHQINFSSMRYHHSHPTKRIKVILLSDKGDMVLVLARDSSNPHEYWVFYPAYRSTQMNDIGKVMTSALDDYN